MTVLVQIGIVAVLLFVMLAFAIVFCACVMAGISDDRLEQYRAHRDAVDRGELP
jgi:hypothetical protein